MAALVIAGVLLAVPLAALQIMIRLRVPPPLWLAFGANNLFLPAACGLLGAAIGRVVRHPNTLLAAGGFAVFFDIVTVVAGTVSVAMKHAPQLISAVSVGGSATVPAGPHVTPWLSYVTVGPADVLFLALFLSSLRLLSLPGRATLLWSFALLFAALVFVQLTAVPVPALAPMGVAVIAANARHGRFTRAEKYALAYGGAFALLLAAGMVAGAQSLAATQTGPASRREAADPPRNR